MVQHWNQCLVAARGDRFLLLQDDDFLSPNYVADLMSLWTPGVVAAFGRPAIVDADGTEIQTWTAFPQGVYRGHSLVVNQLLNNVGLHCLPLSMLACRQALLDVGGYPDMPRGLCSDIAAWAAVSSRGDLAYAPSATYYYRWHGANALADAVGAEAIAGSLQLVAFVAKSLRLPQYAHLLPTQKQALIEAAQIGAIRYMLGPLVRTASRRDPGAVFRMAAQLLRGLPLLAPWAGRALHWCATGRCWTDIRDSIGKRAVQYVTGGALPWVSPSR